MSILANRQPCGNSFASRGNRSVTRPPLRPRPAKSLTAVASEWAFIKNRPLRSVATRTGPDRFGPTRTGPAGESVVASRRSSKLRFLARQGILKKWEFVVGDGDT